MTHKKVVGIILGILLVCLVLILATSGYVFQRTFVSMEDYGGVGGELGFAPAAPSMEGSFGIAEQKAEYRNTSGDADPVTDRLIIKTGHMAMVVKDVGLAVQQIGSFAMSHDGFIVSSYISKSTLAPTAEITVRIPVEIFDSSIEEVKKLGDLQSQQISGQDVTEEYVDLEAQLRNLRATEEQFLVILRQAREIEDILAVQRELTYIRQQIEQIEGRMKYLRESAQLSTLTVSLSTDPEGLPVLDEGERWKPLAVAKYALRNLIELGKGIVSVLIWIAVFIPLWVVIWFCLWGLRKWYRKRKEKQQQQNP